MNYKQATSEFISKESRALVGESEAKCKRASNTTEFDAVHPRFQEPKKPEVIEEFRKRNDYYCDQCKLYFAPTVLGLKTHFKGDMVKHQPTNTCFYCKGKVYSYRFNTDTLTYHNCSDKN